MPPRQIPSVGVRELKNSTSAILRRVRAGESVRVTDRGEPIAVITPVEAPELRLDRRLAALAASGKLSWSGGKPRGDPRAARVRGASLADAVVEDRR
ncbi:MAG: type II toxin-antitoxin system prevent-host-death family antitoxin [Deltaproteobacteria bacterium]|nr:type II toxin-antitoxin system prevent-host-death family antitoxin [Deltaproteobacteria bacterium]